MEKPIPQFGSLTQMSTTFEVPFRERQFGQEQVAPLQTPFGQMDYLDGSRYGNDMWVDPSGLEPSVPQEVYDPFRPPEDETFTYVHKSYIYALESCKDLAQLVGASLWDVSAPPGSEPENLGFYCNSRLFNMAVDDRATLADKICLADDLKDRRDQGYTEALLLHVFPNIPRSDRLAIWRSDELKNWLASDPRGQWCSQNDKAFIHMAVKNYIFNNREKILEKRQKTIPLGQMKAENGSSEMDSEHTRFDDPIKYVNHVIKYWRGPGFEIFDESEYFGPCLTERTGPLNNYISPHEHNYGRVGAPKHQRILEQAKAGNLKAKKYHDRLRKYSGFEDPEDQELEEALHGMHLGSSSRVVSELKSDADSRALDAQLQGEFHARESAGDIMSACRKEPCREPFFRRSIRLANLAALGVLQNPPRRDTGRIKKLGKTTIDTKHADRKKKRDQQCEEDLKQFRLNPGIQLSRKRMSRICARLGNVQRTQPRRVPWTFAEKAALLEIANTDPSKRKPNQKLRPAAGGNGGVSNEKTRVPGVYPELPLWPPLAGGEKEEWDCIEAEFLQAEEIRPLWEAMCDNTDFFSTGNS